MTASKKKTANQKKPYDVWINNSSFIGYQDSAETRDIVNAIAAACQQNAQAVIENAKALQMISRRCEINAPLVDLCSTSIG